jgi:virginiamycin B lyase
MTVVMSLALAAAGCGSAPRQSAVNKLGNRVEAGRDTSSPAFAHAPKNDGGIHAPYAIATSPVGVWFTEYSAPMLGLMQPDGAFKHLELDLEGFPERLAVSRDGSVWFTDPQANRIGRVFAGADKADFYSVPTPKSGPAGINASADGAVWFTEHAANRIAMFVLPGKGRPSVGHHGFKEFPLVTGSGPAGILVARDGSVWFTEDSGNRIGRLVVPKAGSKSVPVVDEYPLPVPYSRPNAIAQGADGNMYFTELAASRIGMISPQGFISELVMPVKGPALDIAADTEGNLWMTVPRAHAICRIHPGTPITAFYLPQSSVPAFIASGFDGNLYFSEPTGKIARMTQIGVLSEIRLSD